MTRHVFALLALLVFCGCADKSAPQGGIQPPGAAPKPGSLANANRYLAYEHTVSIDAADDKVAPLFDAAQSACREAVDESCAILEARVTRGESAFATLRFRAKPAGIRKLMDILATQGKIASQSTSAEDLAGPIEDTAKKVAMLSDYRTQLEELRNRKTHDIDALMKLTRELAETQSQIEMLSGQQAHLVQRVETEILNVTIGSTRSRSSWNPIGESLSSFGENLSVAVATVIIVLSYLLPWAVVVLLGAWGVRRFLRWRRRATKAS